MPRQQARKQLLNFVGGLNTESSPLSFPENTAKALDNVDLNRDGSIKRRRGLDFELGGAYSSASFTEAALQTAAVSTHEWESVDGDDTLNFSVQQVGGILYFHNLGNDSPSLAPIGSINLSSIQTKSNYETYVISTTVGLGKLFIVSPAISPAYIQYDSDAGTFQGVKLTLKIRDTDGIDEEDDDSPVLFGDEITPGPETDPADDISDTTTTVVDPNNFGDFTAINVGFNF